jgi:hypothetical protein
MSQELFVLRPSSRSNIHRSLARYQGTKFVFQLLRGDGFQNQVKQNQNETSQNT